MMPSSLRVHAAWLGEMTAVLNKVLEQVGKQGSTFLYLLLRQLDRLLTRKLSMTESKTEVNPRRKWLIELSVLLVYTVL